MKSIRRGVLLLTEMKIQFRGGLYAVYGAMTLFFLLVLVLLPEEFRQRGFEAIVLLDPAFMGFFFAGGLVLLEHDQGIISLVVTSAGGGWGADRYSGSRFGGFFSWWVAKAGALLLLAGSVVAVLAGVVHLLGIVRIPASGIPYFAVGLALSVPAYFSLGVILAARFTRVLDYYKNTPTGGRLHFHRIGRRRAA